MNAFFSYNLFEQWKAKGLIRINLVLIKISYFCWRWGNFLAFFQPLLNEVFTASPLDISKENCVIPSNLILWHLKHPPLHTITNLRFNPIPRTIIALIKKNPMPPFNPFQSINNSICNKLFNKNQINFNLIDKKSLWPPRK
jgi:hypothetical protein